MKIDLDACAVPTPEQIEQMETGFGAIFTAAMALDLGMKTAIGNVKRALAAESRRVEGDGMSLPSDNDMTLSLADRLRGPLPQRVVDVDTGEKTDEFRLSISAEEREHLIRLLTDRPSVP